MGAPQGVQRNPHGKPLHRVEVDRRVPVAFGAELKEAAVGAAFEEALAQHRAHRLGKGDSRLAVELRGTDLLVRREGSLGRHPDKGFVCDQAGLEPVGAVGGQRIGEAKGDLVLFERLPPRLRPHRPEFELARGLVADLFSAVPEMIEKL